MDILGGLSAANEALKLVRELKDIDRSVDEAEYKLKIAELASALSEAKLALGDAQARVSDLERELDNIKNGDFCPKCKDGRMQLINTAPFLNGGLRNFGVEKWHYKCDRHNCRHEESRVHDPHGLVPATIKK